MGDNSKNVRRCGQIGEGDDDEVSMQDVLDEHRRLQADASAVLGPSDPVNCTYPKGYMNRQALYACATCDTNGYAGMCLACSYACHEGHEVYELYTKRNFCCDCGNDKFLGRECKLVKDKKLNSRNRYNHNFKGLYCSCSRPYPDDDDSVESEMIQCVLCEDWHHDRHLKVLIPEGDDFTEMVCPECMSKFPFLWAYYIANEDCMVKNISANSSDGVNMEGGTNSSNDQKESTEKIEKDEIQKEESPPQSLNPKVSIDVKDEDTKDACDKENVETDHQTVVSNNNDDVQSETKLKLTTESNGLKRSHGVDDEEEVKAKISKTTDDKESDGEGDCLLQSLKQRDYEIQDHATFWYEGWRSKLCKCQDCLEMYKDRDIEFLIDEADTIQSYEASATSEESTAIEQAADETMFAGMHHVQQIEIARGVSDLKTELNEFLQSFVREGKVVTETDIREFFQNLEEKRRRRMNLPQNNCR